MMAISILGNVLSKERKQISVFDFAAPVAGGCVFNGRVVFDSDELRQPAGRKLTGVHFGSGCLMFIVAHSADVVQKILQVASVFTGSVATASGLPLGALSGKFPEAKFAESCGDWSSSPGRWAIFTGYP